MVDSFIVSSLEFKLHYRLMGKNKPDKDDASRKDGSNKKAEDKSKKVANLPKSKATDKSDKKSKKTGDEKLTNKTKPVKGDKIKAKEEEGEEQELVTDAADKEEEDGDVKESPKTSKKTAPAKKLIKATGSDEEEQEQKEEPETENEVAGQDTDKDEQNTEPVEEDAITVEVTKEALVDHFPPPVPPAKQKNKEKTKEKPKKEDNKLDKTKEEKTQASKKAKEEPNKEHMKAKTDKEKSKSKGKKEAEQLEFTKPTINQMVREKKKKKDKKDLSTEEKIEDKEFEEFNDEVSGHCPLDPWHRQRLLTVNSHQVIDLNGSIEMLHLSYGSIIKSLVALYSHREKKAKTKTEKVTFITTLDEVDGKQMQAKANCMQWAAKYDLERFINPLTREETFKMLFEEVKTLNAKTDKLRSKFYDSRGYFLRQKYDQQKEIKVQRKQFNEFWLWVCVVQLESHSNYITNGSFTSADQTACCGGWENLPQL